MATLTSADYQKIRDLIYSDPDAKAVFKVWSISKQNLKDLFQEMENWFVDARDTTPTQTWKAAFDAIVTTTNTQAAWIADIWAEWRQWKRRQS